MLFGLTVAVLYNIANTVRQTVWDAGKGFTPKIADMSGGLRRSPSRVVGAIVVWVIAAQTERSDHGWSFPPADCFRTPMSRARGLGAQARRRPLHHRARVGHRPGPAGAARGLFAALRLAAPDF